MKTSSSRPRLHFATLILLAGWIVSGSLPKALANSIVNGDFATGDLTGWIASAIDANGNSVTPLIKVVDLGGGVKSAVFSTGEFTTAPFISTLEQTFTMNAAEPVLSFDFSLPIVTPDPTGTGSSLFSDTLIVSVQNGGSRELLLVIQDGAFPDPFGTAPGQVALGPSTISGFDFNLRADLSSLIGIPLLRADLSSLVGSPGTQINMFIDLNSADEGLMFEVRTGEFRARAHEDKAPSAIPEATQTLPLLLLVLIPLIAANLRLQPNQLQ